jgi:hypothetical protein
MDGRGMVPDRSKNLFHSTASTQALGFTQNPIQRVLGAIHLGIKRPGSDVHLSHPFCAEVKNAWSYTSTPCLNM